MVMLLALDWRSHSAITRPKAGWERATFVRANLLINDRFNPHG